MAKQPRQLSVLLVEDNRIAVAVVQAQLAETSLNISVRAVDSLESAVKHLGWERFDVVLLDLTLTDSQGLPTFERVQAVAADTPIIVLSGDENRELAIQAVRQGAQDYLSKKKVDSDTLVRSIRYAVERFRRQRAESELNAGGAIQQRLFPPTAPHLPGFDIYARYKPAQYAGGTSLDMFTLRREQLAIVIAEARGSGIDRALNLAATRSTIRAFASVSDDVGEILTRANATLAKDLTEETAVSLFFLLLDQQSHVARFSSAGFPGQVLNPAGRTIRVLESHDPPFGLEPAAVYRVSRDIPLAEENSVFLATRTVANASNRIGETFGAKRLSDSVERCYKQGAKAILDHLFGEVKTFLSDSAHEEDLTAVILKASSAPVPARKPATAVVPAASSPSRSADRAVTHEEYSSFEVDKQGDVAVLRFREDEILTAEKCATVRDELVGLIRTQKPSRLVISFHSVQRISSEAVGICFHAKKTLDAQHSHLRLCELQPELVKSFKVVDKKGRIFSIHSDIAKALRSF